MKDGKGGIFSSWFNMFVSNVLMQSFHAIFMMFLLKFISIINNTGNQAASTNYDFLIGILLIAGIMGIIKFDNLVKKIFQIKDNSEVGSLGHNFYKTMQGIRSGGELISRTTEPFKKHAELKGKRQDLDEKIRTREAMNKSSNASSNPSSGGTNNSSGILTGTGAGGILTGQNNGGYGSAEFLRNNNGVPSNQIVDSNGRPISSGTNIAAASTNKPENKADSDTMKELKKLGKKVGKMSGEEIDDDDDDLSLDDLIKKRDKALKKERKASIQRFTRLGSTLTSVGGAFGSTEGGIAEAITAANAIDKPMDAISDKVVNNRIYKGDYKEARKTHDSLISSGTATSAELKSSLKDLQEARKNLGNSMAKEAVDFALNALDTTFNARNPIEKGLRGNKNYRSKVVRKADSIDSI